MSLCGRLCILCTAVVAVSALPTYTSVYHQRDPFKNESYDEVEARRFASASSATYCESMDKVLDWTCPACRDTNTSLVPGKVRVVDGGKDNATRIVIGKLQAQDGCLMAFRGTDNMEDWIRNLQFYEVHPVSFDACTDCKVHKGFYTIWKNVEQRALAALEEVGCSPKEYRDNWIYITGHSLGGALTHLAMFTMHKAGWRFAKGYSFEAPRVGNKAFSDEFAARFTRTFPVFRITHTEDPIVHLPPEGVGYYHVQTEVFYNKAGKYNICREAEDSHCADQYWNVPDMMAFHSGDHCHSPLVRNGDICNPPGCA